MVLFHVIFLLCTTIQPKIRDLINLIFLFVHDHSSKIIRVLIYIFIPFLHDHSTKIRGHSYSTLLHFVETAKSVKLT